ncbi:basic amino acid ABC transporter substrate-binding protein [Neisseria sp. Ec49-e6-T10]|uniref:basic amino acid ABC transporter substrate-binding protein n=1 Tax=Neisseria sp. Ec49-e6-T10 TaxID=3140744 RepID=UPI003EBCC299
MASLFALSLLALTACQKSTTDDQTKTSASDLTHNVIEYKVAIDANYAPFESQTENGEIVGFSVDILSAMAQKAGFKVKYINTAWEGIFNTLEQGDSDIVSSSVTITDERKKSMDFSDPYFEASQLIALKSNNTDITTLDDLKNHVISVQNGTTGDIAAQKIQGKTSTHIKRFESLPLALKELAAGGVVACIGDFGVVENFIKNNPEVSLKTISDPAFEQEFYGFAIKKGRQDIQDNLNKGLKMIKEDGTYDQIYRKYFGSKKDNTQTASTASHQETMVSDVSAIQ